MIIEGSFFAAALLVFLNIELVVASSYGWRGPPIAGSRQYSSRRRPGQSSFAPDGDRLLDDSVTYVPEGPGGQVEPTVLPPSTGFSDDSATPYTQPPPSQQAPSADQGDYSSQPVMSGSNNYQPPSSKYNGRCPYLSGQYQGRCPYMHPRYRDYRNYRSSRRQHSHWPSRLPRISRYIRDRDVASHRESTHKRHHHRRPSSYISRKDVESDSQSSDSSDDDSNSDNSFDWRDDYKESTYSSVRPRDVKRYHGTR